VTFNPGDVVTVDFPGVTGVKRRPAVVLSSATYHANRPDVLDKEELSYEPLWQQEPIICNGKTVKLVVEVVSTNWQDDYARKVEEYALLGIPEYWIADFRGLGGIQFIGKPKQPTFTVYQLVEDSYEPRQFRLGETLVSPLLPALQLKLDDVMP
jgi:Uma2 family endonuclease